MPAPDTEPRSVFEAARQWQKAGLSREEMISRLAARGLDEESALDIIQNASPKRPSAAAVAAVTPSLKDLDPRLATPRPAFKMNGTIVVGVLGIVLGGGWMLHSGSFVGMITAGFGVYRLVVGLQRATQS